MRYLQHQLSLRFTERIHARMAGVLIERLPYAELIRRYDRPDALFYLDPPYWNSESDYGAGVFGNSPGWRTC